MIRIAIISFPGNNCEVESIRAIKRAGMQPVFHRWNDDIAKLDDIDGYFLPGGFSYEDRGRAGMVAARDPIFDHLREEASKGKVIIGNCNGAQVLVESGLIPNATGLQMCLARNAKDEKPLGFLSEWVFVNPSCARDRCATSDWEGPMHMPIAHGEGRFTTKDKELWNILKKNDQLAFVYSNEDPNGSEFSAAGICNPEGNVVALMPHPERTENGDPYFRSMKAWIESHPSASKSSVVKNNNSDSVHLPPKQPNGSEIFIDTIIVNNEECTVEKAARRILGGISLKQLRYIEEDDVPEYLSHIAHFNPNKEKAYIRRGETFTEWDADTKQEVPSNSILTDINILRTDQPSPGSSTCYVCSNVDLDDVQRKDVLEIFGNPHASVLELLA